jgi:DNA adenine methylase
LYSDLFRYPGGKRRVAQEILFHLSPMMQNGLKNNVFHEPFAGTAAVSIELLKKPLLFDWQVRLSDMDGCLVGFWQAVLNNPETLIADIERFEPTVEAFFDLRDKEMLEPFEFLALHQMSYSGLGRKSQGPLGGRRQGGLYQVGDRWNPEGLVSRVRELNRLMAGRVQIEQADVFDVLRRNEGGVWYLDPPYYEKGGALYEHSFGTEDHKRLRDALENRSGWMLSYDDHPEIRKLYSGFHLDNLKVKYTVNQGKVRKVIPTRELLIGSSKDAWTPSRTLDKSESAAADQADALLINKINAALKAADEAQAEHVSRSKAVGFLLLEAKKLHPK